jgi:hypothetical protein
MLSIESPDFPAAKLAAISGNRLINLPYPLTMTSLIKVLTANEPWAEYQLEDGTLLRFRFSACSFRKTGKDTAQGDPEYSFSSNVQIETDCVQPNPFLKLVDDVDPNDLLYSRASDDWRRADKYNAPAEDCG